LAVVQKSNTFAAMFLILLIKFQKKQIMKKVILSAMVALSAATMANAQLFVGGSVGFDGIGTTTPTGSGDDNSYVGSFEWRFSPVVGYTFNEKFLAAVVLGFGTAVPNTSNSTTTSGATVENSTSNFLWTIMPVARYTAFTVGKFGFAAEAQVAIGGASSKRVTPGVTFDGESTFAIGIGVVPVLSYVLTDHIVLFSYLDFLDIHFAHAWVTTPGVDRKGSINTYGIGADGNTLFTLGTISVGAIWQF
jgi:hypothetical protein